MGYIVEVDMFADGNWHRSCNKGLEGKTFNTFAEAEKAKEEFRCQGIPYRVTDLGPLHFEVPTPLPPKQYKVEIKFACYSNWEDSGNRGLYGKTFDTEAAAWAAIKEYGSAGANYRVVPVPTKEVNTFAAKVAGVIYGLSTGQQFLTADDVQSVLSDGSVGNRAGSFFRGNPDVRKVANITVRSKRAGRNGSKIGVYRSKNYTGPTITAARFAKQYNAKGAAVGQ